MIKLRARTYSNRIRVLRLFFFFFSFPENIHGDDTALARQVVEPSQLVKLSIYRLVESKSYL